MKTFLDRIYRFRYLSGKLILALDLTVSLVSSMLTMLLANMVSAHVELKTDTIMWWLLGSFVFSWVFFVLFRTPRIVIRHTNLRSLARIGVAVFCKFLALLALFLVHPGFQLGTTILVALLVDMAITFSALVIMRVVMVVVYNIVQEKQGAKQKAFKILIYGVGNKSVSLVTRLKESPHYRVQGFLQYATVKKKYTISEYSVFGFKDGEDIKSLKKRFEIDAVLFAIEKDAQEERDRLVKYCIENGLKILIAPTIDEAVGGKIMKQTVREIRIEDLLGREEIQISIKEIEESFRGKVVMVTGAAGSIGSELCRQLAGFGVKQLVLFDNAETPMHNLRLELEERHPGLDFIPVIGDVRQVPRLDFVFRKHRPQVVFHAAAYKHVPLMEENPCEAVLVNVAGSRHVADKCIEYDVEKMVMISTDKAVNPTNIMGCTKRLAEIYVQSLGLAIEQGKHKGRTKFVTTRFGNVLGSNGSVIPRFREQIAKGGPVTVTHPDITRFFMTIPEACRLVMEAATMSTGNQIFVFDMGESVKIANLAWKMISLAGLKPGVDIEIAYTGLRPGEKLYEEVLSNTENTLPTHHHRIRVAKVREYDYADADVLISSLKQLAVEVEIPEMVRLMKRSVPEFKSKNSQFEAFDQELEALESKTTDAAETPANTSSDTEWGGVKISAKTGGDFFLETNKKPKA